ncbi:LysR family transcriptional regulator [Streptomyces sp. NPDC048290]|uniref:LysR family transcriptional regulator n=1 Tax=Streptomyces sp. NPDC048290 TaxID=3155811 RepID=UPI00341ECAA3
MLDVRKPLMLREEVVRSGSIAAAARTMNFARSAVSQQIAALETTAGVPLLQRQGPVTTPTPAGEDLVRHTERVLDGLRAAELSLAARRGSIEGSVRIGLPVRDSAASLGQALAQVRERHPGLTIELRALPPADAVGELRRGLRTPGDRLGRRPRHRAAPGEQRLGVNLAPEGTPRPPDARLAHLPVTDLHIRRTAQILIREEDRATPRIGVVVTAVQETNRLPDDPVGDGPGEAARRGTVRSSP